MVIYDVERQKGSIMYQTKTIRPTRIELLRRDGQGIKGTWANAKHHAEVIEPFILVMEKPLKHLGFELWKQGHNVHEFHTYDGRRFTLRAFIKDGSYHGIRLALRVSRSHEVRLLDLTDPNECWKLLDFMRSLAEDAKGEDSGVMLPRSA